MYILIESLLNGTALSKVSPTIISAKSFDLAVKEIKRLMEVGGIKYNVTVDNPEEFHYYIPAQNGFTVVGVIKNEDIRIIEVGNETNLKTLIANAMTSGGKH